MDPYVHRPRPIKFGTLSELLSQFGGYPPLGNEELATVLLRWNLLDEQNRTDSQTALRFLHWSIATSFLEWLNALQWLAAGFLLQTKSFLPAQVLQSYYYAIFFSYGSFLAIHGKGHYTVSVHENDAGDLISTRRELWFAEESPPWIGMKSKGSGGEHQVRAKWFYEVFRQWGRRGNYPTVQLFENDQSYHTGFRNMFTYSLPELAEEVHHNADHEPIPIEIFIRLWNRDQEAIEYFPEEYWAVAHIRVCFDVHKDLITGFEDGNPLSHVQQYLLRTQIERHEQNAFGDFLTEVVAPLEPYF